MSSDEFVAVTRRPPPDEESGTPRISVAYGAAKLLIWGKDAVQILILVTLVILSAVSWRGHDRLDGFAVALRSFAGDHQALTREIRMQTCVLSLSVDERVQLREEARRRGTMQDALAFWCPWVVGQ